MSGHQAVTTSETVAADTLKGVHRDRAGMSRLVIVSNRVAHQKGATAPGGLTVGLLEALRASGGLWVGWNGEISVRDGAPAQPSERDGISFATFPLPQALHEKYYGGFANGTLWPLFHYLLAGFRYDEQEYAAYEAANELFAEHLLPRLRSADLVWVHDYHLIPLGEKLRRRGVAGPVGFFLHVPFPHFEILRALPRAPQLVRALLAYDVVGFQTESDRDSFLGCVRLMCGIAPDEEGTLPAGGHLCRAAVFPIGVDVEGVNSVADRAQAAAPVRRMVEGLGGRRLIIGVDRLDYSKGLLERFEAYRKFLEDASEHAGRVTYLQIAPLGRQDVQAYAQIRNSLEQSSGRTNGRFAEADWTPIRYLNRNFPHATLLGFLRASDVCLVTPVRDGMNLVAKEFIASQDPADPGVLILSDRAGAAAELSAAVIVNPYDTKGIARAIRLALAMPVAERRERHERLLGALHRNDIHRWHREFVVSLAGSR